MNEFETKPGFLERYKEFYVSNGHLSAEQFDDAATAAQKVQALGLLPGVYWGVTPQITSLYPHLLTSTKLKAQAAGFNVPFNSVESYLSNFPPRMLKRSVFKSVPESKQKIGALFVQLGLITPQQLAMTLGIQQLIRDEAATQARFGMLIMRVASVSLIDLLQVTSIQSGVPFDSAGQFITDYEKKFNTSASP